MPPVTHTDDYVQRLQFAVSYFRLSDGFTATEPQLARHYLRQAYRQGSYSKQARRLITRHRIRTVRQRSRRDRRRRLVGARFEQAPTDRGSKSKSQRFVWRAQSVCFSAVIALTAMATPASFVSDAISEVTVVTTVAYERSKPAVSAILMLTNVEPLVVSQLEAFTEHDHNENQTDLSARIDKLRKELIVMRDLKTELQGDLRSQFVSTRPTTAPIGPEDLRIVTVEYNHELQKQRTAASDHQH